MNHKLCTHGMTLTETLVALSIFLVVMVAVTTFEVNVFSYQRNIAGSFDASQSANMILKKISRELRAMTTAQDGSYPLSLAGTSTISFYSDINGDGVPENETYDNVGLGFKYYDSNMTETSDISSVRYVRVSTMVASAAASSPTSTTPQYSALVELRNLKTNI